VFIKPTLVHFVGATGILIEDIGVYIGSGPCIVEGRLYQAVTYSKAFLAAEDKGIL
jgi:hypothetical protein